MAAALNEMQERDLQMEAVKIFHRSAMYRGSDVRLTSGMLLSPGIWPRQSVDVARWKWKVVLSFPLKAMHITASELKAGLAALKWRTRVIGGIHKRIVHLLDSQVSIAVLVKGRSSSSVLQAVLQRMNALVLASSLWPAYAYVTTQDNPADAPSRWLRDQRS